MSTSFGSDNENYHEETESYSATRVRIHLPKEAKEIILNVYNTLKEEGEDCPLKRTASLTKVPYSTIHKIVNCGVQEKKTRNDAGQYRILSNFQLDIIRRTVYVMYSENILPSVRLLHQRLASDNSGINCCLKTLYNSMKYMGFHFKKIDKRKAIMESYRLRKWRHEYLVTIKRYRDEQRPIIYLDETWFDTHDTVSKSWTDGSQHCNVDLPGTRGKRIIILHAGSENGWIENCLFLSAKNIKHCNVDYHDNMSADIFENWFRNKLLPNLPAKSVIVMDNASYHSRQIKKVPTCNNTKAEIMEYLYNNDIYFEENYNKKQLLEVLQTKPVPKQYYCDVAAEKLGHTVLRLPPYYCVFNPIEMIWSQLKNGIRRFNTSPTNSDNVIEIINSEANKIDRENWKNCVRHVINIENDYININNIVNPLIIRVNSTESKSETDSDIDEA